MVTNSKTRSRINQVTDVAMLNARVFSSVMNKADRVKSRQTLTLHPAEVSRSRLGVKYWVSRVVGGPDGGKVRSVIMQVCHLGAKRG